MVPWPKSAPIMTHQINLTRTTMLVDAECPAADHRADLVLGGDCQSSRAGWPALQLPLAGRADEQRAGPGPAPHGPGRWAQVPASVIAEGALLGGDAGEAGQGQRRRVQGADRREQAANWPPSPGTQLAPQSHYVLTTRGIAA
jgi:hypothetical protein